MHEEDDGLAEYNEILDGITLLIEGHAIDAIIPALTCALAEVLSETGQDKRMSLEFISSIVIDAYESRNNEEH